MAPRLLTLTALTLFAGTALSQAASVVLYDYSSAGTKTPASNGWTLSSYAQQSTTNYIGSYDASKTTFKSAINAWRFCDGSSSSGSVYMTYGSSLSDTFSSYASTGYYVTTSMQFDAHAFYSDGSNGSTNYYYSGSGASKGGIVYYVGTGSSYYGISFSFSSGTITISDANDASSTSSTTLSFDTVYSIAIAVDSTGAWSVYVDGTCVLTGLTSASSDTYNTTVTIGTVEASGEGDWSVYSVNVTAIPEPSAFGLLAGVGALALVAARRRRSRGKAA